MFSVLLENSLGYRITVPLGVRKKINVRIKIIFKDLEMKEDKQLLVEIENF